MDEIEVITLLADHPQLIGTADADKAFWLLTDARLRDMYSAAREGQSIPELAPVQLPMSTAKLVLSGKYAEAKDARAELIKMTNNLGVRLAASGIKDTRARMVEAQRRGDNDLARNLAALGIAERKGDRDEIERIKALLAETSSGKQDD